jgi:hypothetical protein
MDATLKSLDLLMVVTVQATSLLITQGGGNLEAASYLQPRREAFSISFVIISNERQDHCCTPVGGIRAWCFANARRQQTSTGTLKPHSDGRVQRRGTAMALTSPSRSKQHSWHGWLVAWFLGVGISSRTGRFSVASGREQFSELTIMTRRIAMARGHDGDCCLARDISACPALLPRPLCKAKNRATGRSHVRRLSL